MERGKQGEEKGPGARRVGERGRGERERRHERMER